MPCSGNEQLAQGSAGGEVIQACGRVFQQPAPAHELLEEQVGHYVRPTVRPNVTAGMTIAREEVFGPVLVVLGYADLDDAFDEYLETKAVMGYGSTPA